MFQVLAMKNLMIEPTNRCTLKCPTCFSHQDGRAKKDMSLDEFKSIIDANACDINRLSLYNYGEPLCNPHIFSMIRYAKDRGVSFVKLATNGLLLSALAQNKLLNSGLDYLSFSCDGATADTYKQFRKGADFGKLISNIRHLVEKRDKQKNKLIIELQFIIMRQNEGELKKILDLSRDLKVDRLRLKKVLIKNKRWENLLPVNSEYSRYYQPGRTAKTCFKPLKELTINSDGTIIPCCYIVSGDITKFKLGNIFKDTIREVCVSSGYRNFIKKCTTSKSLLSCCAHCQEGNLAIDFKVLKLR